jgi:hypothetical protein
MTYPHTKMTLYIKPAIMLLYMSQTRSTVWEDGSNITVTLFQNSKTTARFQGLEEYQAISLAARKVPVISPHTLMKASLQNCAFNKQSVLLKQRYIVLPIVTEYLVIFS